MLGSVGQCLIEAVLCSPLADVLYTGTADGKILKLVGRRSYLVARLGQPPCGECVYRQGV